MPNVRLRLELPFDPLFTAPLADIGPLGLSTGFIVDAGPVPLLPVQASLPRGTWTIRCWIEDFTSGVEFSSDVVHFQIQ